MKYLDEAEALRAKPGQWAFLMTASSDNAAWSHSQSIKTGRRAAFRPHGHFESTVRGRDVMVRYVGDSVDKDR